MRIKRVSVRVRVRVSLGLGLGLPVAWKMSIRVHQKEG